MLVFGQIRIFYMGCKYKQKAIWESIYRSMKGLYMRSLGDLFL
jgi:hypothetical protein